MVIVFKVSDNVKENMIRYYKDLCRDTKPPYSIFQAQDADTIVTLYETGKVMFQGVAADIDAKIWAEQERILNHRYVDLNEKRKKAQQFKEEMQTFYSLDTVGSDECGTGDYFGPIVVTASYVPKCDIDFINDLGVKDSKKLTDEKIRQIAPTLIKNVKHVTFILTPADYNKYQNRGYNMNKIKAILHNKVLCELLRRENITPQKIVIDQFVYPQRYFSHIKESKEKLTNITFTTQAESKCASVAVSSVISRYIFLREMKKLSNELGIEVLKGANDYVNNVALEIIQKYGMEKLGMVAKLNFKNTEKIKEAL